MVLMPIITSQIELLGYMENIMRIIIEKSTDELMDRFKEYIDLYVYKSHGVNKIYSNNDKKFIDSWEWSGIKKNGNALITELAMNPEKMDFDPYAFESVSSAGVGIHGSYKYKDWPRDMRESMDVILNKRMASSLFVSVGRPIPYWDKFISDYISGGKIREIIKKNAVGQGLTII
jgi:hypothetical protein